MVGDTHTEGEYSEEERILNGDACFNISGAVGNDVDGLLSDTPSDPNVDHVVK